MQKKNKFFVIVMHPFSIDTMKQEKEKEKNNNNWPFSMFRIMNIVLFL